MIVVRLTGGLGNQMFQYAAARALADRLAVELVLDTRGFDAYNFRSFELGRLNVRACAGTTAELARFPAWRVKLARALGGAMPLSNRFRVEPFFGYDPAWPTLQDDVHLNGYFQSQKYFAVIREQLLVDFRPSKDISPSNRQVAAMAGKGDSVMLHVRRGDYVSNAKTLQVHGVCSTDYYRRAIALARERLHQPRFFVFSDDLAWSRENLRLGDDAVFVEGNAEAPEMDIFLMSACRAHIIANSSFSWWGAWLARTDAPLVIAPDPWFDSPDMSAVDLIPAFWQTLRK